MQGYRPKWPGIELFVRSFRLLLALPVSLYLLSLMQATYKLRVCSACSTVLQGVFPTRWMFFGYDKKNRTSSFDYYYFFYSFYFNIVSDDCPSRSSIAVARHFFLSFFIHIIIHLLIYILLRILLSRVLPMSKTCG